jgi:CO/xanthine dehydrogenase FAD-binding subunit
MTAYLRPRTLSEALEMRAGHPDYMLLAGGTDLLVSARDRPAPTGILDLAGLPDLVGIASQPDGAIAIGAATTYRRIEQDRLCQSALPGLVTAARQIGALQIQARGTLGGNIATSSPVGDTLPLLLALEADIVLGSTRGQRAVRYRDFCTGYRRTALGPDELITAIRIPRPPAHAVHYFRKVGTRSAQSISKVVFAAAAEREPSTGVLRSVRIALGAVADRPIRARAAEAALEGQRGDATCIAAARQALAGDISPIDDLRSTARYRNLVAGNLLAQAVQHLAQGTAPAA